MDIKPLYEFEEERRQQIVKRHLAMPHGGTVTGPVEGVFGEVYSITFPEGYFPRRIAAKCPRIKCFGNLKNAREAIEKLLHEVEKTHQVFRVPWINRLNDVQFIHGWPFVLSEYRDGSLDNLIANPLLWSDQDRFATLIQISRALQLAKLRGISTHQDLKPANVFFDDLSRKGLPKDSSGMHFHIFVADFGLADAFRDFGRNSGSRPYMAPEQFSSSLIHLSPTLFDNFALGVIAFECFTNGRHPIGDVTADVWPRREGIANKWGHETIWRKWALKPDKLPSDSVSLPFGMKELISAALSPDPAARPSLEEFEDRLWESLGRFDPKTHAGLRMQIDHMEGHLSGESEWEWPHMEDRLMQLREFYSSL